ncbi:MAG: hypothetical protein CMJ83_10545 [Planctomycetes bacterium]|nr:hypothetical protein [Planctomycetota bacterium]
MARLLASRLHPATEEQSFTSALLQDMAVPVLASVKGEAYGSVLEAWHAQGDAALEHLEHEAFQWDHAEIGSMMATLWELPTPLVGGIGGHHDADEDDAEPAVQLVGHLREAETEAGLERLASDAEARFGIDRAEITDLSQRAEEQADELAALMK